jgi:hypothetical protein
VWTVVGGGGGGITELTGDVTAGPGSGSQAATVAGIRGTVVNATPPQPGFTLSFDGVEWVPAIEGFEYFFGSTLTQDPSANVYSVWADMLASIALQPTGVVPVITIVGIETVPAGTWDLRRGILRSPELVTGLSRLIVPTGATLDNLSQIDYGLVVECQPTIAGESLTFSATPGIHALVIGLSSVLVNSGSAPAWTSPGGGTTCIVASNGVPWSAEPAPTAPLIDVGAGDTLLAVMPVSLDPYPTGWASGAGTLVYQVPVSAPLPSIPAWVGTVVEQRQQVVYAAQTTLYADSVNPLVPVASGGSHVCVRGDEFVRVAPTGTGAITVTLPDPATTTGRTITVKKTTTDVIDAINVVPTAGLIDGAASYPLPASAYSVLSFTSDGTDYWVT